MQHKYKQPGEEGVTLAVDKLQQEVSDGGEMLCYAKDLWPGILGYR